MAAYIVRRLVWVIFLLFVITLITFVIFTVLPAADPAALRAGRQPSPELIESIRKQFGLDKPAYVQFINYVGDILPFVGHDTGSWMGINFGYSYQSNTLVLPEIIDRMGPTLLLTSGAVILWLLIGIPIGMLSAVKSGSWQDRLFMGLALVAISCPVYFLRLLALFLFHDDIGRFPVLPGSGAFQDATSFPGKCVALFMPWCVLAASFAAVYARFLRGNLIETMSEDYIRTARAKGLRERTVVFKHGVRSAITPIVTILGLDLGILLGGAILTETVFNIPGVGRLAYDAIQKSDLPPVQGTVLMGAFFIIFLNLIVDIVYAFLDPRVRY